MTTIWTEEQILLEQYAERAALLVVRGANFTQCMTINGLAPSITVMMPTSRQVTIHGRDLFNERTWKKFLSTQDHTLELSRLTGTGDSLVKGYRSWLLTSYTSRYQALSTQSELEWFEQVTVLVIVRKIMEGKYAQFVREQRDAFADPWVAEEMSIHAPECHGQRDRQINSSYRQAERRDSVASRTALCNTCDVSGKPLPASSHTAPCFAAGSCSAAAEPRRRKGGAIMQENHIQTIFAYETLDEGTRIFIQQKTDETHLLLKRTAENILAIGFILQEIKERLPHGQFLPASGRIWDVTHDGQSLYAGRGQVWGQMYKSFTFARHNPL